MAVSLVLLLHNSDRLRKQAEEDKTSGQTQTTSVPREGKSDIIDAISAWVYEQMDKDRKVTALKALQGHIWLKGYHTCELKGVYVFCGVLANENRVYDDVKQAFDKWKELGVDIYIYSSGSISAQKLLFGYSDKGTYRAAAPSL